MTQPVTPQAPEFMASPTDEGLRQFLGYGLKRTYLVVHRVAGMALQKFSLSTRSFTVLTLIAANPGVSLARLAELLLMERPNLVVIVDELETRELVQRTRDPKDRRRYLLHPTLSGLRLLDQATAAAKEADERLAKALSQEEFALLMSLLRRVEEGAIS